MTTPTCRGPVGMRLFCRVFRAGRIGQRHDIEEALAPYAGPDHPQAGGGQHAAGSGQELDVVCRHLEVAESTSHRWVAQYGGIKASDAQEAQSARTDGRRADGQQTPDVGGPQVVPAGAVGKDAFSRASEQRFARGGTKIVQPLGRASLRHIRSANTNRQPTTEYHCSTGGYDTPQWNEMTTAPAVRS